MKSPSTLGPARRLIILADGGALMDLNERLDSERLAQEERPGGESAARKDFVRIPDAITEVVQKKEGLLVDCPIESRVFCTVGSEKAQNFISKMAQAWTVSTFPLSMVKYDRTGDGDGEKHRFRLRFHAYMGYALGLLTASARENSPSAANPMVLLLTDDPHLLVCIADSKARGMDVRLVWWEASLGQEVLFLAARNRVPTLLLPADDRDTHAGHDRRNIALDQLLPKRAGSRG